MMDLVLNLYRGNISLASLLVCEEDKEKRSMRMKREVIR